MLKNLSPLPRGWEWDDIGHNWTGIWRAPWYGSCSSSPSHFPSPFSHGVLVSSDRMRYRKTPTIRPPTSYYPLGPDREGIEVLAIKMRKKGRDGRRCQLTVESHYQQRPLRSASPQPRNSGGWFYWMKLEFTSHLLLLSSFGSFSTFGVYFLHRLFQPSHSTAAWNPAVKFMGQEVHHT